jgi:ankyrin repeat protein
MDYEGNTALIYASNVGDTRAIATLLKYKADVNRPNQMGDTPLHFAVRNGHADVVNALLKSPKVKVNAANSDGETPLLLARSNRFPEIFQILKAAGAKE